MSKHRLNIPSDPAVVRERAEDFAASYGLPLIAGGETLAPLPPGQGPSSAAQPAAPAAPAAAPAQPAAPVAPAQPAVTPQQPAAPAAPGNAGEPAAPPWGAQLDQIVSRLDELAPPAPVDPLAVELGLAEPPQPLPGQPVVDPSQPQQPTAGQSQPQGLPQQPGVPPGLQVNPNDPAQVAQLQAVEGWIGEQAKAVAKEMINQQVTPYLQTQERNRRRSETAQILTDYPKLKEPAYQAQVLSQARAWAREVAGNESLASEPGFIEVVHLAMEGLGGQPAAAAAAPGGGEVPIEGGGAAQPAAAGTDTQKIAQEIVAAKPGGGLNPLWTGLGA